MKTFYLIKLILILLSLAMVVFLLASVRLVSDNDKIKSYREIYSNSNFYLQPKSSSKHILCYFGSNQPVDCIKSNFSIYLPFELIKKKFDVIARVDNSGNFQIAPSSHRIFSPLKNYNSTEEFLWFADQNVESRDRIKYISLIKNVPISNQWKKSGHFYPIQIAQYGLSHYSKWLRENSNLNHFKNFTINQRDNFIYTKKNGAFTEQIHDGFKFKFTEPSIYKTNYNFDFSYLVAQIETNSSFNLTVDLILRDNQIPVESQIIRLIYSFNSFDLEKSESFSLFLDKEKSYEILFKINGLNGSQNIIRNFCLDSCKALGIKSDSCFKRSKKIKLTNGTEYNRYYKSLYFKVYQIGLVGEGRIKNAQFLVKSPSFEIAKQVADFFVSTQNSQTGGWIINVTRKFVSDSKKIMLKPGWHSAMGQGHAISLLCRLYSRTKDKKYYDAAKKALDLFEINTSHNGVQANFMNSSLIWFEEYPTRPYSLFVLNGFMYSIFGIFDFLDGCQNSADSYYFNRAKILFENAVYSLSKLISLFDTGTRTLYDLGHLVDTEIHPNVARWDYHCVHVSQLNYLINILENLKSNFDQKLAKIYAKKFNKIKKRWENYSKGIWLSKSQIKN